MAGKIVLMPDGKKVRFPDDMPDEEIKALIEDKFPDIRERAAAKDTSDGVKKLTGTADKARAALEDTQMRSIPIVGPIAGLVKDTVGVLESGGGLSKADQASGDWERGILWPVAKNKKTGERKLTIPALVQGSYEGVKSAVTLPGDVAAGKYPELEPGRSLKDLSPEMVGRGLDFAGTVSLGVGTPKGAALSAGERASTKVLKNADEMKIPLTAGQKTGDITQLTKEEILRNTDGAGRNIMRNFDANQRAAMEGAAKTIGPAGDADNLAELVQGGLREKVAFSKERASALYKIAEDGALEFDAAAVKSMPSQVRAKIEALGNVIVDEKVTPAADLALKEIDKAEQLAGGLKPSVPGMPEGDIVGVQLKGLEQIRKRIGGLTGATPEDRRAIRAVKAAYDEWMDDAIDAGLYSGDEQALDAIKAARAETKVYKDLTVPRVGDDATRAVAKMQKDDATAEQVANWLYGANIANPSMNAPKVAAKLKTTFGADSREFQAIRAGAWTRLIRDLRDGELLSATKVSNRIDDFLSVKGSTLSEVLYTDGERKAMKAFADVLRKTIIPRDATNPSRTAFTLKGMFNAGIQAAAGALGFSTGGGAGALAALVAVPVFRNVAGYRAATKAVSGAAPRSMGGAATLGMQGAARGAALMPVGRPNANRVEMGA